MAKRVTPMIHVPDVRATVEWYVANVDEIYRGLKDHVDVVKDPHDTFYGMRDPPRGLPIR